MDLNLYNKVIVVAGDEKSIVKLLTEEGAIPVIINSNEEDNEKKIEAVRSGSGNCLQVVAELTKPDDCKNAIEIVMQQFGKINGLINNARINNGAKLESSNYKNFMALLRKNLVHHFLLTHYALPALKISKGSIVNIIYKTLETENVACAAGNGGHNALTREWAVELLKYNIRVNAAVIAENNTAIFGELANTIAFLLSEKSSHTTGQIIHVNNSYTHLNKTLANV